MLGAEVLEESIFTKFSKPYKEVLQNLNDIRNSYAPKEGKYEIVFDIPKIGCIYKTTDGYKILGVNKVNDAIKLSFIKDCTIDGVLLSPMLDISEIWKTICRTSNKVSFEELIKSINRKVAA